MRRHAAVLAVGLALATSVLAAPPEVVVLRDGSRLRLAGPPRREGDQVALRLHPSGLEARVSARSIDLAATARANLHPEAGGPNVTWGTEPAAAGVTPPASRPSGAASEAYSRELARLLCLQQDLRADRRRLEEERREVERDLWIYLPNPRMRAGLGARLTRVERDLALVSGREDEVARSIDGLLLHAAERAVPLRQLSCPLRGAP